ncbi:MAG: efflux RND transporter permease subunit, partial [Desulfobacterales bacterium]|nr:efflux RND transporter permease subunit [Desulfobacterales bacterium]
NNEILNGFRLEARIQEIKTVIKDTFPGVQDCYAAGIPVIRAAFERYNLTNALIFGGLGLIFGTVTAFCLFKTIWSAVLVMINALVALLWLLGIMGVFGIHVNLASGLSFGFVLIVSCTTVFHILSVYLATLDETQDASHALTLAYQNILRPCFMCALTTATGFLCLTLSPVPMVRQAGIVIGLGVMMSFLLALPITRLFLPLIKKSQPFGKRLSSKPSNRQGEHGILDRAAHLLKIPGFKYPRAMLAGGVMFLIVAAIGIPKIGFIRHLSQPMVKHTAEAKEMAIIQDRLAAGYSFSLLLERGPEDVFKIRKFWYDLAKLENRLKNIDGVTRIDSLTSLVFRLAMGTPQAGIMPERIFSMLEEERRKNEEGETIITRFLNDNTMRIEIHLTDLSSDQIEILLHQVETIATRMLKDSVEVSLAGQLVYLRAQNMGLVSSQLYSLGLALITITVFMIIQLKSVRLGLLSLIPNVFPLVCIFGIMGWFGIALDPLTIFAAVISFGLSVDDSIHYLEAFRQEIRGKNYDVTECLSRAYNKTARALVATTAVLFLSSGGLMLSPISHVASLGVLVAFASLTALAGDLMILPALVGKLEVLYKGQIIHCNGDV